MNSSASTKSKKPPKPKIPVKESLRKAFLDLVSAPNHDLKMRRFAECLIDYQLYAELCAHDNRKKQQTENHRDHESEATASEEVLSQMRGNHSLSDLNIFEDEIEPPSFKDSVREVSKQYGQHNSPIDLPI